MGTQVAAVHYVPTKAPDPIALDKVGGGSQIHQDNYKGQLFHSHPAHPQDNLKAANWNLKSQDEKGNVLLLYFVQKIQDFATRTGAAVQVALVVEVPLEDPAARLVAAVLVNVTEILKHAQTVVMLVVLIVAECMTNLQTEGKVV